MQRDDLIVIWKGHSDFNIEIALQKLGRGSGGIRNGYRGLEGVIVVVWARGGGAWI